MSTLFATARTKTLRPAIQAYLDEHILPYELEWLKKPFGELEPMLRTHKEAMQKLGVWNLYHGADHGGPGLSLTEVAQVGETLGQTVFGLFLCNAQAPDAGNLELFLKYANPDLQQRFVKPMLAGEMRSCFGMTEPDLAGSNPVRMHTTAVREGDSYVVNGRKWFTSSADGASVCIVMAITNPEAEKPHHRASMIVVPTDTEGFKRERNISIMGHAGSGWLSHAEVTLTDVRVPIANLLGNEGEGFLLAQQRLGPGRIHHCMRWIGMAERSFQMMVDRAANRELSEGVVLGDKQMVQSWIAESRAEIDASRLLVLHTAHAIETIGAKASRDQISIIKFTVAGMLNRVVDRAIQVHGGLGVTDDTILSFLYREERAARIYDGTDETHKASLARRILRSAKR
ncbi:MAG: acyl-CoA dehydrogenase family protein [Saprospiraceae bacterium]